MFDRLKKGLRIAVAALPLVAGGVVAAEADGLKVAMVLPGPISDNDWNSVGYNGLQAAAKELGIEVAYSENVSDADAERILRDYASRGYGLVFAHSFSFGDAALNVAEDFPDTVFMAGTAKELAPNLGTYSNPDYQGAYLAGMLGAGASKTKTIGWVGGMPAPNMLANLHAYEAGAKEMVPDAKVLHTFIGSWFDPPKAKEAAIAQVEQGADVLSAQGVGVIDAAIAKNVFALGAMTDQNHLGPKVVLTSVTWDLGPLVTAVAKAVQDKTWKSENWSYGIAEGSVKLADFHGLDAGVPPEVLKAVQAKFEAIKSGAFTVPLDTSNVE
ncbi:BMP family protein [Kaistia geumhonensis]|uniref:Basic membrane protein A n=1 Tax=Kaistia geumhonensis TaxID=410839 RepID=A0ABU0M7K2_9HYPH|nr:BMP family protein [Kaistia geumhonensis]MCX5477846.1 BMP family protein [Kaistia geumhonensis]MDQ0516942.1 basic membrane protein A [Kaistia geumhonensis]